MNHKAIVTAAIGVFCHAASAALVTFEDIDLPSSGFENNYGGQFVVGDVTFLNNYSEDPESWSGFAVSSVTDKNTRGSLNQFSAITGGGAGGSAKYSIGCYSTEGESTHVIFDSLTNLQGLGAYITNTTWAYYEMLEGGEINPKKFGGPTGNDLDWFKLVIKGFDGLNPTGLPVEYYLADFRFEDNSQDYILNEWKFVDFSSLGSVDKITITTVSSATGITVPTYFAMDNLIVVPEPSSMLLLVGGLGLILRRKR